MAVRRFGVSMDEAILQKLDSLVSEKKYSNRSRAIGSLIEQEMVREKWDHNKQVAGAIVLVYDHHKRNLANQSVDHQHRHHNLILSVQHVHLNHDLCLETIAVKGKANELINLANRLIGLKGIKHGRLVMTDSD